jgi:hypothetical protein
LVVTSIGQSTWRNRTQKLETPYAACASASSTLAGTVVSVRASAPARNNRRSAGHTDDRDTSLGSEFSRSSILFISIQKNYEKDWAWSFAKDTGWSVFFDQS